jgi:RNA polymerase sigma-70 factor (ECF subfamily)
MAIGAGFDEVLAAARTGAPWAINMLYRDINPSLLRYLEGKRASDPEDVASEVWIAAARNLSSFDGGEAGFRGWIFTIARRRIIDRGRQAARQRTEPVAHDDLDQLAAGDDTAAAGIERMSAADAIRRLTAGLPPDQTEVLLLRVVAGLDVAEVAELMGRTSGSVRVLQHRALRKLAEQYASVQEQPWLALSMPARPVRGAPRARTSGA